MLRLGFSASYLLSEDMFIWEVRGLNAIIPICLGIYNSQTLLSEEPGEREYAFYSVIVDMGERDTRA